ncbi:ABC transporter permease [Salinicoccus sp. CNSTN-B1]
MTTNLPKFEDQEAFVFLWMFAGIVAVTTATTALGALGKYIEDKVGRKNEDLLITRITKQQLAYSYVFYTFIIGLIFTLLLFAFGFVYTFVMFDIALYLSPGLITLMLLSILMHTLLFYLITSYLKTMSAFSGFSTIVGTLIGFLAGIYIPIGILPIYIQKVMILFPTTQSAVLLRQSLMADVLEPMKSSLPNAAYQEIAEMLGIRLHWDDTMLSNQFSWAYLIGATVFLGLIILIINKK